MFCFSLSFPSTDFSPRTDVERDVYECCVKSVYALTPVQRSVSSASLCVGCHITDILTPPRPGILSSVPSFFPCPFSSLPLRHSGTIQAVCENSSAGRVDANTEPHSAFCQHNRSYRRCTKMQTDEEAHAKMFPLVRCEGDETRCGSRSSEGRSAAVVPA